MMGVNVTRTCSVIDLHAVEFHSAESNCSPTVEFAKSNAAKFIPRSTGKHTMVDASVSKTKCCPNTLTDQLTDMTSYRHLLALAKRETKAKSLIFGLGERTNEA